MVALAGCGVNLWEQDVQVVLPDVPARWAEAWRSAGYALTVHSATLGTQTLSVAEGTTETLVRVPKVGPVAILAHPLWVSGPALASGEQMAPAGAVWSGSDSRSSIQLTYRHGAAASIVATLITRGFDLRDFNAERFVLEIDDRLPDDPWCFDMERVVARIEARAMRASYLQPRDTVEPTLEVPDGSWLPWSPFAPILDGSWPSLPYGASRFYSPSGGRMVVTVEENGEMWFVTTM